MVTSTALLLSLSLLLPATQDHAKDLKSKEFDVRKAAVLALTEAPSKSSGKLLIKALKDDDWEIIELAAIGLGKQGEEVGDAAIKALVKLALEGPLHRIRLEAAKALREIDAEKANELLSKKLASKHSQPASEAIITLGTPEEARKSPKSLQKAIKKGKLYATRRPAVMALLVVGAKDRSENLEALLSHEEIGVHASALDAIRAEPFASDLEPIATYLQQTGLASVNTRRAIWGLRAVLWTTEDADARKTNATGIFETLLKSESPQVARRAPLFLEALLTPPRDTYGEYSHGSEQQFEPEWILEALEPATQHAAAGVRSAAAHVLGRIGTEEALARCRELGSSDSDAHVRRTALASAIIPLATQSKDEGEDQDEVDKAAMQYNDTTATWLIERMGQENDARTREDLCVAMGVKNFKAAIQPLAKALTEDDVWVVVCAAVSLGKTRLKDSLIPLQGLLANEDWRIRGAGVVGIGQSWQVGAIDSLIASVADTEPSVSRAAHDYLIAYSNTRGTEQTKEAWQAWWDKKKESLKLIDPETAEERSKKYGYSTNWDQIYGGLDIVVLNSRGDHIQNILTKLGIQHRLTQAAQIPQSSLHPQAVYVSNCTGEVEAPDIDHLAWFLRSGGYIMASCWSLHETIERVYPGVIRKYETTGQVLDTVTADNCAPGSPYTEGVFAPGVRPLYNLLGAHLIEVLDPERAQVLIDSPECADRWGSGEMAVWFPAGHGIVLDSVNHFEEQGFANAKGLKKPAELQAYAIDHLGLTYADWRNSKDEKYWKSTSKAASEVLDLSVFKLLTNFVRHKRLDSR